MHLYTRRTRRTLTPTRRNPYPCWRVRVCLGKGTGSPGIPQGYPLQSLTSAGHGLHCLTPIAILANEGTQTDAESPSTATCDASIQTPDPPLLVVSPQIANAPPFDWADDATSLPIQILPKPLLPRDFSELRSPKQNPFSSLQHRAKRFTRYSHQPHCRHSHLKFNSFYSPHRNSYKQFQPHFQSKTHSHLNWESNPRLSDLSRSLKALGWIRAS